MFNVEYPHYMLYSLLLGVVSLQRISKFSQMSWCNNSSQVQSHYTLNTAEIKWIHVIDMGTKSIETWLAECLWDVFTDA